MKPENLELRVIDGSLTSLAPGGFYRARGSNDDFLWHEKVILRDSLDESAIEGTVEKCSGPFLYIRMSRELSDEEYEALE